MDVLLDEKHVVGKRYVGVFIDIDVSENGNANINGVVLPAGESKKITAKTVSLIQGGKKEDFNNGIINVDVHSFIEKSISKDGIEVKKITLVETVTELDGELVTESNHIQQVFIIKNGSIEKNVQSEIKALFDGARLKKDIYDRILKTKNEMTKGTRFSSLYSDFEAKSDFTTKYENSLTNWFNSLSLITRVSILALIGSMISVFFFFLSFCIVKNVFKRSYSEIVEDASNDAEKGKVVETYENQIENLPLYDQN